MRGRQHGGSGRELAGVAAALMAACAPDLSGEIGDYEPPAGQAPTVDASDEALWAAYDLDTSQVVDEADPGWDLRLRRVEIELNLGVEAAELEGADYDALVEAPADGYLADDGADLPVFFDWYDYDYLTHVLTPADKVYVVHTTDDTYVKLRFVNYYDEAGTSGMYSFDHAPVDPPGGT